MSEKNKKDRSVRSKSRSKKSQIRQPSPGDDFPGDELPTRRERSGAVRDRSKVSRADEEKSFEGSTLAKRKKPKKKDGGSKSISRIESQAALEDINLEMMPGDQIITPHEVGISSSKHASEKRGRGKSQAGDEERKSKKSQPSQKSRKSQRSHRAMAQETPEDDIPDSENKMELYKFDFKAAARPPFDPNATFQDEEEEEDPEESPAEDDDQEKLPVINTKQLVWQLQQKTQLMLHFQLPENKKDKVDGSYQNDESKKLNPTTYFSRRNLTYDDDKSQDSQEEDLTDVILDVKKKKPERPKIVDEKEEGNSRFYNFTSIFQNLTVCRQVDTKSEIISIMISYDSKLALAIVKQDDQEYWVKMYNLVSEQHECVFKEIIGGKKDSFIKVKEVEQNAEGQMFAISYIDDGEFRLRVFDEKQRASVVEIEANEFNINKELGLDNYTIPFEGFDDPLITCCFVNNDRIFINLFCNYYLMHYHFMYDIKKKEIIGPKVEVKMDTNFKNFPYKCFYNDENNEIYSFYRQGQAYTINPDSPQEYALFRITEMDLGQMYLFRNKALIVRSSSKILFFKIKKEIDVLTKNIRKIWRIYDTIYIRGQIFYIKGNVRIQITSDDKIFYYTIDQSTLKPVFENCLYNFMDCTMCLFGSKSQFCITYKQNETLFNVFRRKYSHEIKVPKSNVNYEGARIIDLGSNNQLCISNVNELRFYDSHTYTFEGSLPINLLESVTREPNEIVGLQKCQNEQYIAVISGKNLIMDEQKSNQVFIFIRDQVAWSETDRFFFFKRIVIKDIKEFDGISMDFHFRQSQSFYRDTLIFARKERIFLFDFVTMRIKTLYKFITPLKSQPQYFKMNDDQTSFVVASPADGIYYNLTTGVEIDLDELYEIGCIKQITYDAEDKIFYLLCNKFRGKLGLFLIGFSQFNPKDYTFYIKVKNLLDIDDCQLYISRNKNPRTGRSYKELIVGYKTINVNTYDLFVYDISEDISQRASLFRHESFQMWESQIRGVLMERSKDYVTISNQGIGILALGSQDRKQLTDSNGQEWLLHNLEGFNFLKVDKLNYIVYQSLADSLVIKVQQEYMTKKSKAGDEQTMYNDVYQVQIHEPTLREILILKSLYICRTLSDIIQLVESQPNPAVFFKCFLELDGSNMTSILSFDSRSMRFLLSDAHTEYFDITYPIFFRNKHKKQGNGGRYFYRSAIDNALKSNQVGAVQTIINYISQYQNNFVSHYLFLNNFTTLIEKGLNIVPMLEGDIFQFQFDYDSWPGIHDDDETCMRPYSDSLFKLSFNYYTVFHEERFLPLPENEEEAGDRDLQNVNKIKYSINLLPIIGEYVHETRHPSTKKVYKGQKPQPDIIVKHYNNVGMDLMGILTKLDQYELFEAEAMRVLIDYKWEVYGRRLHYWGFIAHCIYMSTIIMYNYFVYIENKGESREEQLMYVGLIGQGCLYPAIYNIIQIKLSGGPKVYFSNPKNIPSILFNFTSILTLPAQIILGPFHLVSKCLNISTILLAINRTFNFMRIYEGLSPIVTMIKNVVYDLRIFLFIYFILSMGFCLTFCILGIGNLNIPGTFRDKYLDMSLGLEDEEYYDEEDPYGDGYGDDYEGRRLQVTKFEKNLYRMLKGGKGGGGEYPGAAYKYIGMFAGTFISTIRLSMADFEIINWSPYLTREQNFCFWAMWLITVIINCMIFLNFIIAEASASYQKVVDNLEAMISKQKAEMIQETENMTFQKYKTSVKLPRYIIVRETAS